jgi:hypothetical protein
MRKFMVRKAANLIPSLALLVACGNDGSSTADAGPDSGTDAGADGAPPPGSLLWAQHIGGADYIEGAAAGVFGNQGHSVAALSDGTFCADGSFMNGAVFGAGTANEIELQSAGGIWDGDGFIGRWLPDGTPAWVLPVGGESSDYFDGFAELEALPGDMIVALARVEDDANLDPLGDEPVLLEDENSSVATVYGSDGRLVRYFDWIGGGEVWTHGASYSQDLRLRSSSDGSVVVSTTAYGGNGQVVIGVGEPNETILIPDPDSLFYAVIAKYTADGLLDWAVKIENGSHDLDLLVDEIEIGPGGEVFAAGYFGAGWSGAQAVVYGTDGESLSLGFVDDPEVDETASFLARWSEDGVAEWVKQIPPVYTPSPLFVGESDRLEIMDSYLDGVSFDPGGIGETVIDHGDCTSQFCFFAVEIAPDGSSFEPHLMEGGGSYTARRPDGSFALAGGNMLAGYAADYSLEWEAVIEPNGAEAGAWIHDIAALADGSIVVIGDYTDSIVLGAGEPNETELHGVCDGCRYGAFLARYAW